MKPKDIPEDRIDVYKWIKIAQSVILIILGGLFIMTSLLNRNSADKVGLMLSISLGTVTAVYGILDIVSGYLLYRNPYNQDVIFGEILLSLAVVLFIKQDIVNTVLSYFVSVFVIVCSLILILHGVDTVIGKNGVKKSVSKAVFAFVLAGLLIGGSVFYLVMYADENKRSTLELYMLLIFGVILVLAGIASLSILLVKIRNTRKALKEQKIEEEQAQQDQPNTSSTPTNTDVRVIDISDLRKKNKSQRTSPEQNIIVVEEDDKDSTHDNNK